jgi:dolichol-phosphate mannosyltransferase
MARPAEEPVTGRILVFVPCYNCEPQIGRVLDQFRDVPNGLFDELLIVDNQSRDNTVDAARLAMQRVVGLRVLLVRNEENYGLGGSHKAAFAYAEREGFSHVVVLHGDDQGSVADLLPLILAGDHLRTDACLGARFMPGSRLVGYSTFRRLGNHVFNALFSVAVADRIRDLGSGLNVFARTVYAGDVLLGFPDDLRFNVHLLLSLYARRLRLRFFPISWRETDQITNVKMVSQALRTLRAAIAYRIDPRKALATDHRPRARDAYHFEVLATHDANLRAKRRSPGPTDASMEGKR